MIRWVHFVVFTTLLCVSRAHGVDFIRGVRPWFEVVFKAPALQRQASGTPPWKRQYGYVDVLRAKASNRRALCMNLPENEGMLCTFFKSLVNVMTTVVGYLAQRVEPSPPSCPCRHTISPWPMLTYFLHIQTRNIQNHYRTKYSQTSVC